MWISAMARAATANLGCHFTGIIRTDVNLFKPIIAAAVMKRIMAASPVHAATGRPASGA